MNRVKLSEAPKPIEVVSGDVDVGEPRDRYTGAAPKDQGRETIPPGNHGPLYEVNARRRTANGTVYTVAVAFCKACVFKYGIPRSLLSDNGPQFNAKFFRSKYRVLEITKIYTSAYHPQTNGQV